MTVGRIPNIEGGIQPTLLTTTGDIMYATAASTPARLGIGSSAQVLTVSGGIPSWATPTGSSASWSQIGTLATTSGGKKQFTGLSSYNQLLYVWSGITSQYGGYIRIYFNDDITGTKYQYSGIRANLTGATTGYTTGDADDAMALIYSSQTGNNAGTGYGSILLQSCTSTAYKVGIMFSGASGVNGNFGRSGSIIYTGTSGISSIEMDFSGQDFDGGSLTLFGSVI